MSNPLKGPCPHCGAEIYIRVTVSSVQVSQPPAAERATPAAAPRPVGSQPTNGSRPTCEDCGSPGAILEQVVKKPGKNQGRRFSAYTCPNDACESSGDIIDDTFVFLDRPKKAAQA